MIANYTESGWQIITQRCHGVLAAQLSMQWRVKDRPSRWLETILAIAEHDDAENELDGENLLTNTGGPLHFTMKKFDLDHCRQLASLSLSKGRYIALLTSMHMQFVYGTFANEDDEALKFLNEQKASRSRWIKELKLSKKEAEKAYDLLEWCDACSLLLCKGDIQPEKRKLEVSTGPDKKSYYLTQIANQTITVEPWPFETHQFEVRFESRTLPQMGFSSSSEFRQALVDSSATETKWKFQKATPVRRVKKVPLQ